MPQVQRVVVRAGTKISLYGYYKQALNGDVSGKRPESLILSGVLNGMLGPR